MSFLGHIRACNNHDLARFRPFKIERQNTGWVRDDFIPILARRPDLFTIQPHAVSLAPSLANPAARTERVEAFLLDLRGEGLFPAWRGERYPVTPQFGSPPLMAMERAAVARFGIRAYGVHMVGYVRKESGLHIWVARRAKDKPTYPGMLDNTVAGGQPEGLGLIDNMVKECREEAGIPEALARQVKPAGFITYCMEQTDGLKPDLLYTFDLDMPADFTPRNIDGEIATFELWPAEAVLARVGDTVDFKFNCNLVLIDFFIRHGLIAPDHPDYFDLVTGLRTHIHGPDAASP